MHTRAAIRRIAARAGRRSGTVDQSGRITAYQYDTMGRLSEVAYARHSGIAPELRKRIERSDARAAEGTEAKLPRQAQADWQERLDLGLTTGEPANEPSTTWMSLTGSQRTGLEELFEVVKEDQWENLNTWDKFWTEQFSYDNRGNRSSKTNPWGTVGYDYDANNRMILAGNRSYGYDANGNLASENNGVEQVAYTYNHSNRMESMLRTVDGAQTASSEYAYDALGRRSRKAGGNAYEGYLYDGMSFQTAGIYALDRAAEEQISSLQKELRGPSVLAPSDNFRNGFWGHNRNLEEGARVLEEHQWVNGAYTQCEVVATP